MERLLSEARAKPPRAATQADVDQAALMAQPEVQAHLRDILTRHYEAWVDEKLPALQGKTPREAVRTAGGREEVDALIRKRLRSLLHHWRCTMDLTASRYAPSSSVTT